MRGKDVHVVLSENIRRLAARRGVSLNGLADLSGVSRSQLYEVLAGRRSPTVDWLARLAEALGATPWKLLRQVRPSRSR